MKKIVTTILVLVFIIASTFHLEASSTDTPQLNHYSVGEGVTIGLTADWDVMPDEVIGEYNKYYGENQPELEIKYSSGFFSKETDYYFEAPYILVQKLDGTSGAGWDGIINQPNVLNNEFEDVVNSIDSVKSGQIQDAYVDMLGYKYVTVISIQGEDMMLIGTSILQLTKNEIIGIYIYIPKDEYEKYIQEIKFIIENIEVDSSENFHEVYSSYLLDKEVQDKDDEGILYQAFVAAVAAIIVAGSILLFRRTRKQEHADDEVDSEKKCVSDIEEKNNNNLNHVVTDSIKIEDMDMDMDMEPNNDVHDVSYNSKFCRKCGNQLLDDSLYCDKCGTKVIERT